MTLQEILALLGKGATGVGSTVATAGIGTGNIPVAAGGAGLAGLGALLSHYATPQESSGGRLGEILLGSPGAPQQYPRYSPPQMQFIQSLLPLLSKELGEGQTLDFGPIAEQAQRRFQQQTVPGLAERFTAMTGGRSTSPSLINQLGRAGANLESDLAAQQAQYGLSAQQLKNQRLNMLLGGALQPAYAAENIIREGQPGALQAARAGIDKEGWKRIGDFINSLLSGKKAGAPEAALTTGTASTANTGLNPNAQTANLLFNNLLSGQFYGG